MKEYNSIYEALKHKACHKQKTYRKTLEAFEILKTEIAHLSNKVSSKINKLDRAVEVGFSESGEFEANLKFSGDTLLFVMHTNVFNFPSEHYIHKSDYINEDPRRSYCGMILIYNFLSDSIKYNRMHDIGYLIARVFINSDMNFFVQGKRQFSFLYKDIATNSFNAEAAKQILNTAVLHAIDFDLLVPPFEENHELTLFQKVQESGNAALKTGKRLGFSYSVNDEAK